MTISTSYINDDTLHGGILDKYRFSHWLCDIMRNFMSDPQNIRDDRMRGLVFRQDGIEADECCAHFQVALPLSKDSRKACATPAILVSAGEVTYPINIINNGLDAINALGGRAMYDRMIPIVISANIAVVTESLDGTNLLGDLISEFLLTNTLLMTADSGIATQLNISGRSATQAIAIGSAGNAKDVFQETITLSAAGSIHWVVDTQGPVYRGIKKNVTFS